MLHAQLVRCLLIVALSAPASSRALDTTLLLAGPMLGYVEHREACIWLLVSEKVREVKIRYTIEDNASWTREFVQSLSGSDLYQPVKCILRHLPMGRTFRYEIFINGQRQHIPYALRFRTKHIWEFRSPPPDFSFLTGSCMFINDPESDRPGKPYGRAYRILDSMAAEKADFMLWLGDHIYLREGDWTSYSGFVYRWVHTRTQRSLQPLLAARPNYFLWDDHDYGPNDSDGSFVLKETALEVFKQFTANPTYGHTDNPGTYTQFTFADCDFFLLDQRYYRSSEKLDSLDPDKQLLGRRQMDWLKGALLYSKASFKFIVSGTQVLDPLNRFESVRHFSREFNELLSFIKDYRIKGVVFISGDRHYSDLIRWPLADAYPLYDITSSALTSGSAVTAKSTSQGGHPYRVVPDGVTDQNYVKISISGPPNARIARVQCITVDGGTAWTYEIRQEELTFK